MKKHCDALVVGAGPAGLISALTIANRKFKVILAEKKNEFEIGKKVCGDAVSIKATTFLKNTLNIEPPHGNELNNITQDIILRIDSVEEKIPKEAQLVDRYLYSQRLLEKIRQSNNTEILAGLRAKKVVTENGKLTGVEFVDKSSNHYVIKAKMVLDCSGVSCILRKSLSKENYPFINTNKLKPQNTAICYREIIQLKKEYKSTNSLQIIYSEDIPLPGYFWIFPKTPKMLNLGITFPLNKKSQLNCSIKDLYKKILLNHYKDKYSVIHGQGATYPIKYPLLNAINDNFIVAGDAAFHIDPLFGEGYGPALLAGYYAGKHTNNALETDLYTSDALWGYNIDILQNFGQKFLINYLIESFFHKSDFKTFKKTFPLLLQRFKTNSSKEDHLQSQTNLLNLERIMQTFQEVNRLLKNYPPTPKDYSVWRNKIRKIMQEILEFDSSKKP